MQNPSSRGKVQKKYKKVTRTRICTGILGSHLYCYRSPTSCYYSIRASLTARPPSEVRWLVCWGKAFGIAAYMLMCGCLPAGGGWRDDAAGDRGTGGFLQAVQGRCEESRSRTCDWVVMKVLKVDLGLYEMISTGFSFACLSRPDISFDISLKVVLFVQITCRVSRVAGHSITNCSSSNKQNQEVAGSLSIGEGSQRKSSDSANAYQPV